MLKYHIYTFIMKGDIAKVLYYGVLGIRGRGWLLGGEHFLSQYQTSSYIFGAILEPFCAEF